MPILIIILLVTLIVLFIEFSNNYYTQVKVMRKFFKNIGNAPEDYLERSSVINNVDYLSVFANGSLDIYTANNATEPQPVILWVHGGGYVGGDKSCIKSWAHVIACETKAAVISVNYCLAPEQHYPTPIIQIDEALKYLTDNAQQFNLNLASVFLGGDSAGAQISSQYAALVYSGSLQSKMNLTPQIKKEQLKGIILCCGFYNMDTVLKTHFPAIKTFLWAYTHSKKIGAYERRDEMSSVKNLSEGYCDVFITCGNTDPFISQAHEFIQALREAGANCCEYLPKDKGIKLGHEYQFMVGEKHADTALQKAVEFIESRK